MKLTNIGSAKTLDAYIAGKLEKLKSLTPDFKVLFPEMFSEKSNVFFEKSASFRILKTTYGEAEQLVLKRTRILREAFKALPADAVVGLYMGNTMEWLLNFWAILAAGFSPLLLNLRLDTGVLTDALTRLSAKAVVTDSVDFGLPAVTEKSLLEKLAEEKKEETIFGSDLGERSTAEILTRESVTAERFGSHFYMMTSGTSSRGKICGYTAEKVLEILKNSERIIKDCALMKRHYNGELKQLCFLPFYHVFGMVAVYLWFGYYQRTFVELKDMAPKTILSTIHRHEVTHVFAVPMFWDKVYEEALRTIRTRDEKTVAKFKKGMGLLDKLKNKTGLSRFVSRKAFKEVRDNLFGESPSFLISGGGYIREEVLRFFNHIGYHLSNGYGMTEIGITSVELSDNPAVLLSGSVGEPMQSVSYKISEEGSLLVKGTSLAEVILTETGETRLNSDTWFETKDLAKCENGRFYLLGREDDLIVAQNGENLNPNLIEGKIKVPGVTEVCLTAYEAGGNVHPVLLAGVAPDTALKSAEPIREALYAVLSELKLSESIEKTAFVTEPLITGDEFKLNRKRLAKEFANGTLKVLGRIKEDAVPESDVLDRIRRIYGEVLRKDPAEIGYTTDFFLDEGGSSLDLFALISGLTEEFHVMFPLEEGRTTLSMKELHEYIESQIQNGDSTV